MLYWRHLLSKKAKGGGGGAEGFPKAPGLNRVKYEARIHPLKLISYSCREKTMNVDYLGQVHES